ncbi:potassium/proton antiporter [Oscillatoria sp. FACHB-1406]|uniref:potassium/proton antiporter n=1 Tax=Oscillatoria sp. FACHB-1406 TaxID=2692846 RepID=UPI00168892F1|nr:potassium/proton antiporter [Oscillatoria sp. FACHB-1406]MBD2577635.1 potassium/proton antiporter [Oscillatoria sp. FACHB-1406]
MPPTELIYLAGAFLLLISIFSSQLANKFGIPALLFFLLTGWLMGQVGGFHIDSPIIARLVGDFALSFILFTAGLDTQWKEIRPVLWNGLKLSTIGVFMTMLLLGIFAWLMLDSFSSFSIGVKGISFSEALLLAAIVSSTDAAAVFSVLRSSQIELKGNIKPLLELESSSNDPMAVLLTTTILNLLIGENVSVVRSIFFLILQLIVGIAVGFLAGKGSILLLNRLRLNALGLYAVASIALVLLTYSTSTFLKGNGFLAVYIAGIVLGNHRLKHQDYLYGFHDGFAWLMQIIMFLSLGMLAVPFQAQLSTLAGVAISIGLFMMFVARPLGVFISLLGTKMTFSEKLLIAWVGLRGSVPIVLATFPLSVGIEQAGEIFVVVSFIVVMSVFIQGLSLPVIARRLGLVVN